MNRRFQSLSSDRYICHRLDSMSLIFHRDSGVTHIVADPVPDLLRVMDGAALSSAEIVERLQAHFDLEYEGDVHAVILDRLTEMAELGLVEQL